MKVNINENKNSFFTITCNTSGMPQYQLDKLDEGMDLVLESMKVNNYWFKFIHKNLDQIVYFFKTETRKRKGQLVKACQSSLPDSIDFNLEALTKFSFEEDLARMEINESFKLTNKPSLFSDYSAQDIKIFDDPKNWHSWQKEIYDKIFHPDGSIKEPHPRHIISLVDRTGNSGKSSFFKWLFYKNPNCIGRIGYGTASQLRSGIVNIGKKPLYIVDLARSKGKGDREEDLLSVLEDVKTGLVTNAMYGSGATLLMEPPTIIVSSNYILNYELLSGDRWQVYEILHIKKKNKKKIKILKQIDPKKAKETEKPKLSMDFIDTINLDVKSKKKEVGIKK